MEPEGSLPHSQEPANCPYPEPAVSSPQTQLPLPERSILILLYHLCLNLPSVLFPSPFPHKTCIRLSTHTYALHVPPISFFLECYSNNSTLASNKNVPVLYAQGKFLCCHIRRQIEQLLVFCLHFAPTEKLISLQTIQFT